MVAKPIKRLFFFPRLSMWVQAPNRQYPANNTSSTPTIYPVKLLTDSIARVVYFGASKVQVTCEKYPIIDRIVHIILSVSTRVSTFFQPPETDFVVAKPPIWYLIFQTIVVFPVAIGLLIGITVIGTMLGLSSMVIAFLSVIFLAVFFVVGMYEISFQTVFTKRSKVVGKKSTLTELSVTQLIHTAKFLSSCLLFKKKSKTQPSTNSPAVILFPFIILFAIFICMVYLVSSLLSTGEDTLFQNIISIPLMIPKFIQEVTKAPLGNYEEHKFPKVPYFNILPKNPHININEEVYETNESILENFKVELDKTDINIAKASGNNQSTGVNGYNVVCTSGGSQNIEELIQVAQNGKLVGEVNDENS